MRVRNNKRRKVSKSSGPLRLKPPQLDVAMPLRHTFRFASANLASITSITATDILGAAGVYTQTANSSVVAWYTSFKIHRVRVWAYTTSSDPTELPVSISLEFTGGASFGANRMYNDISLNSAQPAFLDVVPPKDSSCSFWQNIGSNVMFILTAAQSGIGAAGSVILDLDLSLQTVGDTTGNQIAVATAAAGSSYFLALDGPSSNTLIPVAPLPTTH
jgi:hypothetical protein